MTLSQLCRACLLLVAPALTAASLITACASAPPPALSPPDAPPSDWSIQPPPVAGRPPPVAGRPPPVVGRPPPVAGQPPPSVTVASSPPLPSSPELLALRDPRSVLPPRARGLVATEIQALEALYQTTTASSPDRPKLLRRLAESYVELALAGERDGAANLVDNARKAAVRDYTMLLESYPSECQAGRAGCADEVAYLLAYEYERLGMLDAARKWYLDLLQRYPSSRFVPFGYLAFGEQFAGDETKWMLAEQAYEKVISFPPPDNRVYGYALLRLAQIQARLGRSDKARALGARLRALAAKAPGPYAEIPARLLDAGASGARARD